MGSAFSLYVWSSLCYIFRSFNTQQMLIFYFVFCKPLENYLLAIYTYPRSHNIVIPRIPHYPSQGAMKYISRRNLPHKIHEGGGI